MKISKINISSIDKFSTDAYPKSGIFLTHCTDISMMDEYMIVNKSNSMVLFIGFENEWESVFNNEDTPNDNSIGILRLQTLKLTNTIDDSQYKQLLAMLASGKEDASMAIDSIKTLINTNT